MRVIPCAERVFPYRIQLATFQASYLRWLTHLGERLGIHPTLALWQTAFAQGEDALLTSILAAGWRKSPTDQAGAAETLARQVAEALSATRLEISGEAVASLIENTPPIAQIRQRALNNAEKDITAFETLHLRFDGPARLAETLIEQYGKQGELMVYDMMVAGRLAAARGKTGSVAEFIENFTAEADQPNLFTAGLQTELVSKTSSEVVLLVRECEWARYFHQCHPTVGYLMACSTDEVEYRAFNPSLRLQRTGTLMEGGALCDFRIYTVAPDSNPAGG